MGFLRISEEEDMKETTPLMLGCRAVQLRRITHLSIALTDRQMQRLDNVTRVSGKKLLCHFYKGKKDSRFVLILSLPAPP